MHRKVMLYFSYFMLAFTSAAAVYDSYQYLLQGHNVIYLFLVSFNIFIFRLWKKWLREYQ